MRVYVLLFNTGTENEGIHTLKLRDNGQDVVLAFESEEDAIRYGVLLEAQDFLAPAVEGIEFEEIVEFCEEANYDCVLVETGFLAIPPESTVEQTDWQQDAPPDREAVDKSSLGSDDFSSSELEQIRRRLEGLL